MKVVHYVMQSVFIYSNFSHLTTDRLMFTVNCINQEVDFLYYSERNGSLWVSGMWETQVSKILKYYSLS